MNIWILTEEKPRKFTIETIIKKIASDLNYLDSEKTWGDIKILPLYSEDGKFTFRYLVSGIKLKEIDNIYIENVSGHSSFVDYLVFIKKDKPLDNDIPDYAIEETKTDQSESRNTGTFQRGAKFVYLKYLFPKTKLAIIYSLRVEENAELTDTYKFGAKCFATLGVEILGKIKRKETLSPFESVDEVIEYRSRTRKPPKGNVPVSISKVNDEVIKISGRLVKNGKLGHDPNIGALLTIAATLREVGWNRKIVFTEHGLPLNNVIPSNNKFSRIAQLLGAELEGLELSKPNEINYWRYSDTSLEKVATIYLHNILENYLEEVQNLPPTIFDNHAGCEKGYFYSPETEFIPVKKYLDREKYKAAPLNEKKKHIIALPDLVIYDEQKNSILMVEGEVDKNYKKGIEQISTFENFKQEYLSKYDKDSKVRTGITLTGNLNIKDKVWLSIHKDGTIEFTHETPGTVLDAYKHSLSLTDNKIKTNTRKSE